MNEYKKGTVDTCYAFNLLVFVKFQSCSNKITSESFIKQNIFDGE